VADLLARARSAREPEPMSEVKTRSSFPGPLDVVNRIHEIGLIAFESSTFEDVVYPIIEKIMETMGADFVGIALIDEVTDELFHGWGSIRGQGPVINEHRQGVGQGVVGTALSTGQPVCVDDLTRFPGYVDLVPGMHSELAVPLMVGGQIIGGIDIECAEVGKYGEADTELLVVLASPVAQALHAARLYQQERRRLAQLVMLNRLARIVVSTIDVDEMLAATVEVIRDSMGCAFVGAGFVDEDNRRVSLDAMSSELRIDLPIGHSQPMGEGVVGEAVRTGEPILVADVSERDNIVPTSPELMCEMCAPLLAGDRVVGYIDVEEREPGALGEDDLMLLETVADHVAQALANARNLERLQQLRKDLTGMVVHDLRNPLTVIRSTLEFLKAPQRRADRGGGQADPQVELSVKYLEQADAACTEMALMVDSILDLNKIEAGAQKLDPRPVSAGDLARGIVARWSVVAEAAGVALECRSAESLPGVLLDEDLVTRVLKNLVANAIKFTPEGGRILLEVEAAAAELLAARLPGCGEGVVFSVRDNGPGIPQDELERIFEKFATVESRRAGKKYSTGLGLAFCKLATLAHGGAIWAESEVGRGSWFRVLLPARLPD
jgi:signal transduction histidine kinase